jgi:hypothetical protein
MKYLLLLYDDVAAIAAMRPEERRALVEQHMAYSRALRDDGAFVYGDPLSGPEEARTLRFGTDGDAAAVTDGPFIETKESLGGFYVIDCATPEAALALARRVPRSPGLVAELRPIPDI